MTKGGYDFFMTLLYKWTFDNKIIKKIVFQLLPKATTKIFGQKAVKELKLRCAKLYFVSIHMYCEFETKPVNRHSSLNQ